MDKYFQVPMDAARAIVESSEGPELLAGYMTLRRWAQTKDYGLTSAGAKAIRNATGVSDWRSKHVLNDLLALRFGDHGELFLVEPTGKMVKNAKQYRFGEWPGSVSYLPDLLLQGKKTPLIRLGQADELPEVRRDALLMLLHAYAHADYGAFMGVDPSMFIYKKWTMEGERETDRNGVVELGFAGVHKGLHLWIMEEDTEGYCFSAKGNAAMIYGGEPNDQAVLERFWAAHALLVRTGMLCHVVLVQGREPWPLWVGSPAYRKALEGIGLAGNLADTTYRVLLDVDADPDNPLAFLTYDPDKPSEGTGLYVVPTLDSRAPVVTTVYCPTFHAPTPLNLDALGEMSTRTSNWLRRLKVARRTLAA